MKKENAFLKICHDFGYAQSDTLQEKWARTEAEIRRLKEVGYDGIVSNVRFEGGYLDDADEWALMEKKAALCRELGLRLWVYDERGYPSGVADTHTLREVPDGEARAAVMVHRVLGVGEEAYIPLPHGHLAPISACGYATDSGLLSDVQVTAPTVRATYTERGFYFKNTGDRLLLCLCFFEKFAFEGTHCQHNVFSSRRYIDIGNRAAGDAFLHNTYERYCTLLREYIADGTVEAFFTDEPSYMGVYMCPQVYPPRADHQADDALPLYPLVNWSKGLAEKFRERCGYDITENMTALFLGGDDNAYRIRTDFYTLLSSLAEEAYFGNIGAFCARNGVAFSGHLLLEDKLSDHVPFEGNYFRYLSKMQIPGMDMLHSVPENVWSFAFTPVLVRSVSELYRDGRVMDEVSAFAQGDRVSSEEIFASLLLQYCLGSTIFTSYYGDRPEDKAVGGGTLLQRVKAVLGELGERCDPRVYIHYPIETMMRHRKPFMEELAADRDAATVKACEDGVEMCLYAVLDRQLAPRFADTDSIELLLREPPRFFLVPPHDEAEGLDEKLQALQAAGCTVLQPQETQELQAALRQAGIVRTGGDTQGVAAAWGQHTLLLVNAEKREKRFTLDIDIQSAVDCWYDCPVSYTYNLLNGKAELTLRPYGAYLIRF